MVGGLATSAFGSSGAPLNQQGPKLTGAGEIGGGEFGISVAVSADGNTAIVGGMYDHGQAGAAWVFTRSGSTWTQQGPKLTPDDESGAGIFGISVSLSADGNTALIGGGYDNGYIGAAWVFTRSGSTWTQQGPKLTASDEDGEGVFGQSVSLSADGNTALIGGQDDASVGAVWVFTRTGSTWTQQGSKLTPSDESGNGQFGYSVALSGDATTALVGGPGDNNQTGAAWVFARTGSGWTQQGPKLAVTNAIGKPYLGSTVALSADGNTGLIGGTEDNYANGAAWVFSRSDATWTQGQKLTASDETGAGNFGTGLALSADGGIALIGGFGDNNQIGASWVFTYSGSTWTQLGSKVTANDESGTATFGSSGALSSTGNTAIIGGRVDNNGAGAAWPFTLALPTSADQCKNGGWQSFGVFKNQGDCVSYVATGGTNPPGS